MNIVRCHEHTCWRCNAPATTYAFPVKDYLGRSRSLSLFVRGACNTCADMDAAILEAKDEQRRYTEIEHQRCPCGAVRLSSLGSCIQCEKRYRMMERAQAEARFLRKALTELRREIKQQIKQEEAHEH